MSGKGNSGEAPLRFAPVALSVLVLLAGCQSRTLSVADGFNLWVGRVLGELFIVALFFGIPALLIGGLLLFDKVARMFRRKAKARAHDQ